MSAIDPDPDPDPAPTPRSTRDAIADLEGQLRRQLALERAALRASANRRILVGVVAFSLGLFVTLATYTAATDAGGGRYLVAWGPMIWGVIQIGRGIAGQG